MDIHDLSGSDVERMEAEGDIEGLIKVLMYGGSHVRWVAAQALGRIGDARAVEPLLQALKDEDEWLGSKAASALRGNRGCEGSGATN